MAKDQHYDDSLLETQENLAGVDYDNLDSSGLPKGEFACVVDLVKGKQGNFDKTEKDVAYTCGVAVLKLKCIEGQYKGQTKFDDVRLPPKTGPEPDWAKNRRVSVLNAFGIIKKGDHEAAKTVNWKNDIEGRKIILVVDAPQPYTDDDGNKKPGFPRVKMFGGYKPYDGTAPATQSKDEYKDI